jgi:hypothetical protein
MSENAQVQSDGQQLEQSAPVEQQEQQQQADGGKRPRSAEELEARLKEVSLEAKTYRQKLAEEKKRIADLERKKLEEGGQFQELANRYKLDAESALERADKLKQAFALKTVSDKVAVEAAKLGCVDPELLSSVLPLDQIKVDEMFNVDTTSVKTLIEDVKRSKPYLFQKAPPKVNDVSPLPRIEEAKLDLSKLSMRERAELLIKLQAAKK